MKEVTTILIVIVIIMISLNYYIKNKDVVLVKSNIDNRNYRIADAPDKVDVADLLAEINGNVLKMIDVLKNNKDENVQRLCKNYNPDRLGENLEYKSYKAYSVNKGEEIVLCVRDENGKLIQDKNTMMFVLIHELAHVMTYEDGHPPIFWENMGYLLKQGANTGVYNPIDYSKNPVMYCGVLVNKKPYTF